MTVRQATAKAIEAAPTCYHVEFTPLPDDEGGYIALAPELPGCMSDGETPEEALADAYDAIGCWIEAATKLGHPIPQPRRAAA